MQGGSDLELPCTLLSYLSEEMEMSKVLTVTRHLGLYARHRVETNSACVCRPFSCSSLLQRGLYYIKLQCMPPKSYLLLRGPAATVTTMEANSGKPS